MGGRPGPPTNTEEKVKMADHDQDAARIEKLIGMTAKVEGTAPNGRKWVVNPPHDPKAPRYPKVETHTWNAWPALAMEIDGYSGVELYDPYTGRRMYAFGAYSCDLHANDRGVTGCGDCSGRSIYDTYRAVIDAAQAAGFFDEPED